MCPANMHNDIELITHIAIWLIKVKFRQGNMISDPKDCLPRIAVKKKNHRIKVNKVLTKVTSCIWVKIRLQYRTNIKRFQTSVTIAYQHKNCCITRTNKRRKLSYRFWSTIAVLNGRMIISGIEKSCPWSLNGSCK